MNLDTSSYYPKSPLDDEPEREMDKPEGLERPVEADGALPDKRVDEPSDMCINRDSDDNQPPTVVENAITSLSHLLSWVLVPLLMPVYGIMLAFGLSILTFTPMGVRIAFTGIVTAFCVVIPAVVVLLLKKLGLVQDVGLNGQKERFIPYLVTILCMAGTGLFMNYKGAPMWLVMFYLGGALTGVIEVIINRWWKISAHAAGIAGIVAMLVHLFLGDYTGPDTEVWLLVFILLAGMLGSARVWLGRHTLGQVLAGYLVGFCSVFFLMAV